MNPALLALAATLFGAFAPVAATETAEPTPACNTAVESCSLDPYNPEPPPGLPQAGSHARESRGRGSEEVATRPFSAFAIGLKAGVGGFGLDIATPLNRRLNLRAGGSFFAYTTNIDDNGLNIDGSLNVRRAGASLDIYPFAGAFRISPGITLYNGNRLTANVFAAGGQNFDLGDTTYTSNATDPVRGSAVVSFGRRVAPSLTIGFGNMIPRTGRHFSFPFEVGVEYNTAPRLTLGLTGAACQGVNCGSVTSDPGVKYNLAQEQVDFNTAISPLRFFPIFSFGVGYRF